MTDAGAAVLALVCGLPREQRRKRLFFVLQAYIDDSGNNASSPVTVLAGFVASPESWALVSERWEAALSEGGLAFFKMRECNALRGQFNGWDATRRDKKLMELAEIIKSGVIASTFAIVRRDEFLEFTARHGTPKSMRSPYFILYHGVISATLRSMRELKIDDKVDFIFDEQFKQSDVVQSGYSELVQIMEPTLLAHLGGRPIHRDDKQFLPLQAADLLAWHIRRWYHSDETGEIFQSPLLDLLRTIPFWGIVHTADSLRAVSDIANGRQMLAQLRQAFSRDGQIGKAILKDFGTR